MGSMMSSGRMLSVMRARWCWTTRLQSWQPVMGKVRPMMSFALPSAGHQLTIPDGGGTHGGGVLVNVKVGGGVCVGVLVGMLVEVVTTNRNRVVSDIRHVMSKHGGNLAESGAVGWMFSRKGDIYVPKEAADEDKVLSIALEAGAEDVRDDDSSWEILTPPEDFEKVREALVAAGIQPSSAEVAWVAQNYIKLTGSAAQQMLRMVEALEEHDDVQHVYANFDIDESEIQAAVGAE